MNLQITSTSSAHNPVPVFLNRLNLPNCRSTFQNRLYFFILFNIFVKKIEIELLFESSVKVLLRLVCRERKEQLFLTQNKRGFDSFKLHSQPSSSRRYGDKREEIVKLFLPPMRLKLSLPERQKKRTRLPLRERAELRQHIAQSNTRVLVSELWALKYPKAPPWIFDTGLAGVATDWLIVRSKLKK